MDIKSIKAYIEHREQSTKANLDNASGDSWKSTYQIVLNELAGIKNLIENMERVDKVMGVK